MGKKVLIFIFILLTDLRLMSLGQDKDSLSKLESSQLTVWGYADIYYGYNFNDPPSRVVGEMVNGNSFIYSHNRHNEFNLNNGMIGLKYLKNKVRGAIALQSGTYVVYNYASEPEVLRHLFEAYAGCEVLKNLWIDAGIFTSHIGPESAMSFDDLTLSRSMMADNTPYYETGVKATYEIDKKVALTGLVLNGWQNITDHNKNKAIGTQLLIKPNESVVINYSTFFGKEVGAYYNTTGIVNTDSLSTWRFFNNFYIQADLKKITFLAAFDIGLQRKLKASGNYVWYNPNFIFKYAFTEKISLSFREEYYHDKKGVIISSGTPQGFQTFATSIGLNFRLTDKLLWRIEGKIFSSKNRVFLNHDRMSSNSILALSSLAVKF